MQDRKTLVIAHLLHAGFGAYGGVPSLAHDFASGGSFACFPVAMRFWPHRANEGGCS